jgi:WD40 repeat protein
MIHKPKKYKIMKFCTLISVFVLFYFCTTQLSAQEKPEVVVTQGHTSHILDISYSQNGRFLVTGSQDRSAKVWDLNLKQEFRTLNGHTDKVTNVAFMNKDKNIVTACKSHLIVWEHPSGKMLQKISINTGTHEFEPIPNSTKIILKLEDDEDDAEYAIIDILTGKRIGSNKLNTGSTPFAPHPKDSTFILTEHDRESDIFNACAFNYYTGQKVKTFAGGADVFKVIRFNLNGKHVAGVEFSGGNIWVWDYKSTKVLMKKKVNFTKMPVDMQLDKKGQFLWTITRLGVVHVYEVKTGELVKTLHKLNQFDAPTKTSTSCMSSTIAFSPNYKTLAIGAYMTKTNLAKSSNNVEMLINVNLLDTKKGKIQAELKGNYKVINKLEVGPKGKYILSNNTGKNTGLRLWNTKDGVIERYMPNVQFFDLSEDGKFLVTAESDLGKQTRKLTIWAFPSFKLVHEMKLENEKTFLFDLQISNDGETVLTNKSYNPEGSYLVRWKLEQYNLAKKTTTLKQEVSNAEAWYAGRIILSPDGKYVAGKTNTHKYQVLNLETKEVIVDIDNRVLSDFHNFSQLLSFIPNTNQILLSIPDRDKSDLTEIVSNLAILDIDKATLEIKPDYPSFEGFAMSGHFNADGTQLVVGNDDYFGNIKWQVSLVDWETKKLTCNLDGHNSGVSHVRFEPKGKRIFSASLDGFINTWDIKSCALKASMIAMNELDYLIIMPDGYYKSSKNSYDDICFRYSNTLYTFDQFDLRYNRPDKVLTNLGASKYSVKIYTKAWEKRVRRMGFTTEMLQGEMDLPTLTWTNKNELPLSVTTPTIDVKVKAEDKNSLLDRLVISVNNVPVPSINGYDLKGKKSNELSQDFKAKLSYGSNLVKVSVINENGVESVRESVSINYEPNTKKQPNLYIYAIGVSEFAESERNLKFATKDASDLIKQFESSNYFGNVITKTVFNAEATKENIISTAKFLKDAQTDDQIMIYVSSHGLLSDDLNYFLATHDVNFEDPTEKGLAYDQINQMLDGINCRNRLIMIDACHSGEVDKEEAVEKTKIETSNVKVTAKGSTTLVRPKVGLKNSFSYMKALFSDVSKGTGATVISAAGGYEFALESDDWNNGVFTYAILNGLKSGDADINQDLNISVLELKKYVTAEVIRLTEGKQHPTTRSENTVNNFQLYKVKE